MDIQSSLREYDAHGVKLTLHIGVGSGKLTALLVGGVAGSWEWLVSGTCLSQLDSTVEGSKEGEVVISNAAFELIKSKVEAEARGPNWLVKSIKAPAQVAHVELDLDSSIEPSIRCHILKGVLDRIDSGHSDFLGLIVFPAIIFTRNRRIKACNLFICQS